MTSAGVLPQLDGTLMLTDSGIETDVLFNVGRDLPAFAVFPLLEDDEGVAILERYYRDHLAIAVERGVGYVFETPSWRSSPDWGASLGYSQDQLDDLDRRGVEMLLTIRAADSAGAGPVLISGLLGPRGDGYRVGQAMSAEEARAYHRNQVQVLAAAGTDFVSACTLTYADEGVGIVRAAQEIGVPVVLAFTVETDGLLPDGSTIGEAIATTDDRTDGYVAYYGINCAHPDHIAPALVDVGDWTGRISLLRSNASRMSHAELDEAEELDDGDPDELARDYLGLRASLPALTVFGGCCGTDARHIRTIADALLSG